MRKDISSSLLLFILTISLSVFGETTPKVEDNESFRPGKSSFEMGLGFNNGLEKVKMDFIYGFPINSNFSLGLGTGAHYYLYNEILFPLFANFRVNFTNDNITPYLSFNAGYYFDSHLEPSGLLLNPTIGICFKTSKKLGIDLGLGYDMRQNVNIDYGSNGSGAICINMGFTIL